VNVSPKIRDILRNVCAAARIAEHEHAEALALLNRLSPNAPQWARDAVAAANVAMQAARARETLVIDSLAYGG
jgi:hypothetical protein